MYWRETTSTSVGGASGPLYLRMASASEVLKAIWSMRFRPAMAGSGKERTRGLKKPMKGSASTATTAVKTIKTAVSLSRKYFSTRYLSMWVETAQDSGPRMAKSNHDIARGYTEIGADPLAIGDGPGQPDIGFSDHAILLADLDLSQAPNRKWAFRAWDGWRIQSLGLHIWGRAGISMTSMNAWGI